MRLLVGCEFSGAVRDAFRRRGHEAWSCDFEEPEGEFKQYHFRCDVREVLGFGWDMAIFHPSCQYLSNSGAKHLYLAKPVTVNGETLMVNRKEHGRDPKRWANMEAGAAFFKFLLNLDIPKICVENPIQHPHAAALIGAEYSQIIEPFQFGHPESKATCLWLKNLPPLEPTNIVCTKKEAQKRIHSMGPSPTRSKDRARFYTGWGEAMSLQWG